MVQGRHAFLLVTLDKSNLQVGAQYLDHFTDPGRLSWHSQTRTARGSKHGAIISGTALRVCDPPVRAGEQDPRGEGAPFVYCGDVDFQSWEGDAPISVVFRLREGVPERPRRVFGV